MTPTPRVAVVVAIEFSDLNLDAMLRNLDAAAHADVEFFFCRARSSEREPWPAALAQPLPANVRCLDGAAQARIPHLWRDGIVAARAPWVALLSAHCIPQPDWMAAVLALEWSADVAGIGGWFENDTAAGASDWAIHLLRYVHFSRPRAEAGCSNIAADNAVYRRSEVLCHPDLLERGFWEPEFHRRFFAKGLQLRLAPELRVVHRNRYTVAQFSHQRRDHGFMFGSDRARRLGLGKLLLYLLASPLIPAVLWAKIEISSRRMGWHRATPSGTRLWLLYFTTQWASGEARGLACELLQRIGMHHAKPTTTPVGDRADVQCGRNHRALPGAAAGDAGQGRDRRADRG